MKHLPDLMILFLTATEITLAADELAQRRISATKTYLMKEFAQEVRNRTHKLPLHPPDAILFFHRRRRTNTVLIPTACRTFWGTYATP